jgi:DNA-binding response OmpR family regulator
MTFVGRRVLVVEDEFLVSLATTDFLESIGCEIVGPAARLTKAIELVQSELLDAAVLDIDIAGEMIWPVAAELQDRGVPFLFLSAHKPLMIFPALFAAVPCLDKPLETIRLRRFLGTIWPQETVTLNQASGSQSNHSQLE